MSDRAVILSISSMKTMPFCSAAANAFALMSSSLISLAASSSVTEALRSVRGQCPGEDECSGE